jgi:hypothetical protein
MFFLILLVCNKANLNIINVLRLSKLSSWGGNYIVLFSGITLICDIYAPISAGGKPFWARMLSWLGPLAVELIHSTSLFFYQTQSSIPNTSVTSYNFMPV